MGRRRFLLLTVFVAASVGTWQALKWFGSFSLSPPPVPEAPPDPTIEIVRRKLPYLRISDDDIAKFARDLRNRADKSVFALQVKAPEQFEYEVCSKLLMSTDFFFNGADVGRAVRYMVYYDPYKACTSPFAKMI